MAKTTNTKASMFLNMVLIVSVVLIIAMAEGRSVHGRTDGLQKAECTLDCESVVSVKGGDTCPDIAETFKLTAEVFGLINPNLNCDALFVGQWLCVDGSTC